MRVTGHINHSLHNYAYWVYPFHNRATTSIALPCTCTQHSSVTHAYLYYQVLAGVSEPVKNGVLQSPDLKETSRTFKPDGHTETTLPPIGKTIIEVRTNYSKCTQMHACTHTHTRRMS